MNKQSGNILFYILIAIFLLGSLTVALRSSGDMEGGIDKESANTKAQQIIRYGAELAQAVQIILDNGASETDIRFSIPGDTTDSRGYGVITTTPENQVFSGQGGRASLRKPPAGASTDPNQDYNFNAYLALPQIGSGQADLFVSLQLVDPAVCQAINTQLGVDTMYTVSNCMSGMTQFTGTYPSSPTALSTTPAVTMPVPRACVKCSDAGNSYIYFSVLLAR